MAERKSRKTAEKPAPVKAAGMKEQENALFAKDMGSGISDDYSKLTEVRDNEVKKNLITRLSRMEGQIKGVRQMVENDRYCVDLVVQGISLVAALKSFCRVVMEDHLEHQVAEDLKKGGGEEKTKEFLDMLQKIIG